MRDTFFPRSCLDVLTAVLLMCNFDIVWARTSYHGSHLPTLRSAKIWFLYVLFQNTRPSAEGLPEDLALIVTSCWKEDPNDRPDFSQIIRMLLQYLSKISPLQPAIPPRIFASANTVLPPESPGTSTLIGVKDDSAGAAKPPTNTKPTGFFCCFRQCC